MGPHGLMPYSEAGGSPDYVAEMTALTRSHPTLTWIIAGGRHIATWDDDEGSQREECETLRELYLYVKPRLSR